MNPQEIERFGSAFEKYINVTLKSIWNFKENYRVEVRNGSIKLGIQSGSTSDLLYLLKIDKYKSKFINAIIPAISKLYPSTKEYGVYLIVNTNDDKTEIIPKDQLYLDIIPYELFIDILYHELFVSKWSTNTFNLIKHIVGMSTRDNESIYDDLIAKIDLEQTGGKLWKWLKPVPSKVDGKIKHFTLDDYENLSPYLMVYYDSRDDIFSRIKYDINITTMMPPDKYWQNKTILDFLIDISTNFDAENGYPSNYSSYNKILHIFYDSGWYSQIKMRQFYPHFAGVPHEERFALQLYAIKSALEAVGKAFLPSLSLIKTRNQFLEYMNTGIITGGSFENIFLFEPGLYIKDTEYLLNYLLYDKNYKFKDFEQYTKILYYLKDSDLLKEYKDYIPKEYLERLKALPYKEKDKLILIYQALLIEDKDRITDYWGSIRRVNKELGLKDI